MASISYPTKLDVPGPWLLDATNLRDLDGVVDSCVARMQKRREELVASAVAKKMEGLASKGLSEEAMKQKADEFGKSERGTYPLNTNKRSIVVYMSGGRSADGRTFEELATVPRVSDEIPRGFALRSAIADSEITVKLAFSEYSRNLELAVSCPDPDFAQELFGRMENWVSDIQPKKWLQMWLKAGLFASILLVLVPWAFCTSYIANLQTTEKLSQVRQQARDLAKQGVTSSNETKALQLLLSIESGYEPGPVPSVVQYPSPQFWIYFGLAFSVAVAFRIPPRGAIGMWGGKRALDSQRRWIRIVSISVPSIAVSSVFVRLLVHWLGWLN
jgi:hypothetical protein